MAIPVGRPNLQAGAERFPLYGARAAAFAGYAAALVTGVALVGSALRGEEATAVSPPSSEAQLVEARRGETLGSLAASHGVSLARLVALNPGVGLLGPAPGQTVRVR
ncbi:MAG TPA: LysM domain-containing protein [Gaiellaceae bacterium]|nr:LysM domain-containing protein [Gaiellaceae bacterium]